MYALALTAFILGADLPPADHKMSAGTVYAVQQERKMIAIVTPNNKGMVFDAAEATILGSNAERDLTQLKKGDVVIVSYRPSKQVSKYEGGKATTLRLTSKSLRELRGFKKLAHSPIHPVIPGVTLSKLLASFPGLHFKGEEIDQNPWWDAPVWSAGLGHPDRKDSTREIRFGLEGWTDAHIYYMTMSSNLAGPKDGHKAVLDDCLHVLSIIEMSDHDRKTLITRAEELFEDGNDLETVRVGQMDIEFDWTRETDDQAEPFVWLDVAIEHTGNESRDKYVENWLKEHAPKAPTIPLTLQSLLVQAGDLPKGFKNTEITNTPAGIFHDTPPAQDTVFTSFEKQGKKGGVVTLCVYDSKEKVEQSYRSLLKGMSDAKPVAGVGEKCVAVGLNVADIMRFADVLFVRRKAVVYIRLVGSSDTGYAVAYAKKLDSRLVRFFDQ